MKKTILLIISVLIFVFGTSVVVFNNAFQLGKLLIDNKNLTTSFVALLVGVIIYSIINREKLKERLL